MCSFFLERPTRNQGLIGKTTKPGKTGKLFDVSHAGNAEIPPLGKPQLVERVFPVQLRLGGSRKGLELLPKYFCNDFKEGNKNSVHRSNTFSGDGDFSSKAWKYFLQTEPVSFPDNS